MIFILFTSFISFIKNFFLHIFFIFDIIYLSKAKYTCEHIKKLAIKKMLQTIKLYVIIYSSKATCKCYLIIIYFIYIYLDYKCISFII